MARLGTDRGRVLLVRQKNIQNGETYAVTEFDYIEGAYDPDHYDIIAYNDPVMVPKLDDQGNAMMYPDSDVPIMVRTFPEVPAKEIARLNKAAADERKDAHAEARAITGAE